MDQPCSEHNGVCKDILETRDNTQKIIIGLYGNIDHSSKGFIHHVEEQLIKIDNSLNTVKSMRSDFVKMGIAVITAVLTAAGAVVVAMVGK